MCASYFTFICTDVFTNCAYPYTLIITSIHSLHISVILHRWPQLCILAVLSNDTISQTNSNDTTESPQPIGCVVCKFDIVEGDSDEQITSKSLNKNSDRIITGYYIGMLAVEKPYCHSGIGTALVDRAIYRMKEMGCTSIRLERN